MEIARNTGIPPPSPGRSEARTLSLDWDLALALFAYAAASLSDYLLTLAGLLGREIRELNPLLNAYIDLLGAAYGLMVPKLLLGLVVVPAASLYIHAMYRQNRTRIRAEHILYPGALFTVFASLHWVILKYCGSVIG